MKINNNHEKGNEDDTRKLIKKTKEIEAKFALQGLVGECGKSAIGLVAKKSMKTELKY